LYARCGYLLRYTSATVVTLPRGGGGGGMTGAFGGLHGLGGGEPTLLSASAPCGGDGGAPLACRSRSFQYCSLSGVGLPSRPTDCCCDDDPAPAGWCFLCLADHHAASAIGVQSKLYFPRCGGPGTRRESKAITPMLPLGPPRAGSREGCAGGALSRVILQSDYSYPPGTGMTLGSVQLYMYSFSKSQPRTGHTRAGVGVHFFSD
jgi:hypothetical protein